MATFRMLIGLLLLLMLVACVHSPRKAEVQLPVLQLQPSALGQEISLQQRLHFAFGSQEREMDALLEVDADEVRLVVQAMGQVGVRLFWDGNELKQQRAPWLPPQVRAERVLDDLQFSLWPASAIAALLPPGWTVIDDGQRRELRQGDTAWLLLERGDAGGFHLENRAEGYSLRIESLDMMVPVP